MVFCGRLLSLSIRSLRLIHGVACIRTLFLYVAIWYPIELFACKHGVRSLTQEDKQREPIGLNSVPLRRKAMAPHSSTLAWKIPWTEEPGRLQSMGSLRVGHD